MNEPIPLTRPDQIEPAIPFSEDAERAVLGSVLLDGDAIGRVGSFLGPKDFYRERNATIYGAMLALYERGESIDYLTLTEELERHDRLQQAGDLTYLSGLLQAVPTPIHIESYGRQVSALAFRRRMISAGGQIATLAYRGADEPQTLLERAENLLFNLTGMSSADADFVSWLDVLQECLENLTEARSQDPERRSRGLPTGFLDLDKITGGGLQRSDLIILAARPAMGKTSLALALATNAALSMRLPVAFFSLEMSRTQLAARVLSAESGIGATRMRSEALSAPEMKSLSRAVGTLSDMKLWIDDTPNQSVTAIRSKAKRLMLREPIEMIVVDHLQLAVAQGSNRQQEVGEASRQLKALARDLNIPVLALSQLSRNLEQRPDKRPRLSDLRDSGELEQNADLVIMMYRDDAYNEDSDRNGIVDLLIEKHRSGPTGQVSLAFNRETTRFLDLELITRLG